MSSVLALVCVCVSGREGMWQRKVGNKTGERSSCQCELSCVLQMWHLHGKKQLSLLQNDVRHMLSVHAMLRLSRCEISVAALGTSLFQNMVIDTHSQAHKHVYKLFLSLTHTHTHTYTHTHRSTHAHTLQFTSEELSYCCARLKSGSRATCGNLHPTAAWPWVKREARGAKIIRRPFLQKAREQSET